MIRPFTLRDLPLVRRLSEQGISLHTQSDLADNLYPLRGALFSMVVGGDFPTYVWKSEDREMTGFIQLLLDEEHNHARILFLSPAISSGNGNVDPADNKNMFEQVWLSLLDQAVVETGQHGVHSLVAEVSETGPELPVLRRAGFAVYTRQDIWILEVGMQTGSKSTLSLQRRRASDDWDIQLLYANMVPRLVQLVEPMPTLIDDDTWILRNGQGELEAFVHTHQGSAATWMRFFIHPNAEADAYDIVTAALQVNSPRPNRPVYCCVRRYEGWLTTALERSGFRIWGSQAVMVKHTVHYAKKTMPKLVTAIDGQGIPVSSPYVQRYESNGDANQSQNL